MLKTSRSDKSVKEIEIEREREEGTEKVTECTTLDFFS
jgi:hypothetical protein